MIFIDYHSRVAIYEQIKEQFIMLINTGVLSPDEKLPSIRALSSELNINVNTIKRAFSELEKDGVIYSAQGRGVFVSSNPLANERIKTDAISDIEASIRSGVARGVEKDDLINLINRIYSEVDNND